MFKKIDHVEIIPGDFEKTIGFFTEILGFKIKRRMEIAHPPMKEIAFLELNGTFLEIISVKNPSPPSTEPWQVSYKRIALEVEDMDKAIEFLKSKGVTITQESRTLPTSKRAEIEGPDGLSVELRQWCPEGE